MVQSKPPIPPILGLAKSGGILKNGGIGSHIYNITLIWDLKMGGGIGRATVLRGLTVPSSGKR